MAQNMAGAAPLTRTLIEARAQTTWTTKPTGATTAYALLSQFCCYILALLLT